MTKSRLYIYTIAGGYVAYTGISLLKSALEERPDNYILYLLIGIVFIAVGGFFAVKSVLRIFKGDYAETKEESEDEQEGIKDDRKNDSAEKGE